MEQEILETVLQREESNRGVARVIRVLKKPGLPKGENYLSIITKLEVEVVLGSGRRATRALILKSLPEGEEQNKLSQEENVFKQETMMYTVILKEMDYLMEEFQDPHGPIWCTLIDHKPYSYLLMQDLMGDGFKVMPRQDCLDLDHAKLALRNIARFHAMGKVLESRGVIHANDFKPCTFTTSQKLMRFIVHQALLKMREAMLTSWPSQWSEAAERLNIPVEEFVKKFMKMGEVDESRFNVLNHGDCWNNNMLFKHDEDGRPIAHRLVDFQVCFYNSFCWDIVYFMFGSVRPQVRRDNFNLLLHVYHKSLLTTLNRYNYTGRIPELSELHSEVERTAYFRLFTFMVYSNISSKGAFDLETVLKTEGMDGHNADVYRSDKVREAIGPDVLELMEKGVI